MYIKFTCTKGVLHVILPVLCSQPNPWSEEESKALVNYVLFRGYSKSWPASGKTSFWNLAANFVGRCTTDTSRRTGLFCFNYLILDCQVINTQDA